MGRLHCIRSSRGSSRWFGTYDYLSPVMTHGSVVQAGFAPAMPAEAADTAAPVTNDGRAPYGMIQPTWVPVTPSARPAGDPAWPRPLLELHRLAPLAPAAAPAAAATMPPQSTAADGRGSETDGGGLGEQRPSLLYIPRRRHCLVCFVVSRQP